MTDANLAVLGIVIDPSAAQSGAQKAIASMNQLVQQAQATESGIAGLSKAFQAFSLVLRTASDAINIVRAGFDLLKGAWSWISGFVDAGAQVERFRIQFGGLLGDYGKADAILAKLRTYANQSPFQFPQVTEAARSLYTVTGGLQAIGGNAEDVVNLLKKVGDSTPDPQKLGEVADSVGRLFVNLRAGVNYDDPARSLAGIGVVSGDLARNLQRAVAQGTSFRDLWAMVNKEFDRSSGNSERMSRTYEGLTSSLTDIVKTLKADVGSGLASGLKQPIADLTEWLSGKEGVAMKFGAALNEQVRAYYGAWKNGELGNLIIADLERAYVYGNNLLHRYLLDPISDAKIGQGLLDTAANFRDYLIAAFDDGGARFHAVFSVVINELGSMLASVATETIRHLPTLLGGAGIAGAILNPSGAMATTVAEYYSKYKSEQGSNQNLSEVVAPFVNSIKSAVANLSGLGDAANKAKGSLTDFAGIQINQPATFGDLSQQAYRTGSFTLGTGAATPVGNNRLGSNFDSYTSLGDLSSVNSKLRPQQFALPDGPTPVSVVNISPSAGQAITGKGNVFGLNMNGSLDMTDVGRFKDHFNDHHGAYQGVDLTDPSLAGAAISPAQASMLTGISDTQKAMAELLGKFIQVTDQMTGKTASVQVVDIGPGRGIEMTPAAHRLIGNASGNDPLSAAYGSQSAADAASGIRTRALMTNPEMPLADAGKGMIQPIDPFTKSLNQAEEAMDAYGIKLTQLNAAQKEYDATVGGATAYLLRGKLSLDQYTEVVANAREKLASSNATYQQLARSIGYAAAEQARYNQYVKAATQFAGLNQLGTSNSLRLGFQQAVHQQGTEDQQYVKLAGDAYSQLGQSATGVFDQLIDNNGRLQQSFGSMVASLLKDIAKLIIRMEVLALVQKAVGLLGGGGGDGGYLTSVSSTNAAGFSGGASLYGGGHSGAMIGGLTTLNRAMDPSVFYGAPRHHGGGMLGYDEVPFIGLRGERVLNRAETAAYNRGGGSGGVVVNMPVTYHAGQATDQTQSGGGSTQATTFANRVKAAILPIIHEEANRSGGIIDRRVRQR